MNILNLLIKEKNAVGVEINDNVIRVAYFRTKNNFLKIRKNKKEDSEKEIVLIEEPISENTILEDKTLNENIISQKLNRIWKKENLIKRYAIVSIPESDIYTNSSTFPKTVDDMHLKQAVELAIDFQLPFNKKEVYLGWENNLNSNKTNDVTISCIKKEIADKYIKILSGANIDVLALESHIASISRLIKTNNEESLLIKKENKNDITFFIVKNNYIRFSRTIPKTFLKENTNLEKEINKIKNSYETEFNEKLLELNLTNVTIKDQYKKYFNQSNNSNSSSKWIIPLCALIRGEIKNGEDKYISLLPINTIEAYEYKKIKTFITLIRNISIGISLFFLFAFLASYSFIFYLSQTKNNVIKNLQVSTVSTDIAEKESSIQKINSIVRTSSSILSKTPNWSILLDEIRSRVISGITISSFGAQSLTERISITGISINRDTLNKFKKNLQESPYITNVELPITNLEQKADIPFSMSFKIKNPDMLYYK